MKSQSGQTLVEMVALVAGLSILLCMSGQLFAEAWRTMQNSLAQAEDARHIGLVAQRWRRTVEGTIASEWCVDERSFRSGARYARVDGDRMVFADGSGEGAVSLPAGTACAFTLEKTQEGADCAVMTLGATTRDIGRVWTNSLRVVACGRRQPI